MFNSKNPNVESLFSLIHNKNILKIPQNKKDRFLYTLPTFKKLAKLVINDNNQSNDPNEAFEAINTSEMCFYKDLLLILKEDGAIYVINTIIQRVYPILSYSVKYSDKLAKSISLNKLNNTMLIVYLTKESSTAQLKCAVVELNQLRDIISSNEYSDLEYNNIFLTENLSSPAFVEFDDNNSKIITRNSLGSYKIWNMKDYKLIFELTDRRIEEIRSADGILLTIKTVETNDKLLLSLYNIDNGKVLCNYVLDLLPGIELEILEIFDKTLLTKQANSQAVLVNLIKLEYHFIKTENLDDKSLFMYVNKSEIFITLNKNSLIFFNLKGEEIRRITNENIGEFSPNFIHLTPDKKYLVVYWEERKDKGIYVCSDFNNKTPKSRLTKSNRIGTYNSSPLEDSLDSYAQVNNDLTPIARNNYNNKCNVIYQSGMLSAISKESKSQIFLSNSNIVKNFSAGKRNSLKENKFFFPGEFELINLSENLNESKLILNSDNCKIIGDVNGENLSAEQVSYFTFNQHSMRFYILMQSGIVFECAI